MFVDVDVDPDTPAMLYSRGIRTYALVAQRMYGLPVVNNVATIEVTVDGVVGVWVYYGRNGELRKFIPKMYMILELSRG